MVTFGIGSAKAAARMASLFRIPAGEEWGETESVRFVPFALMLAGPVVAEGVTLYFDDGLFTRVGGAAGDAAPTVTPFPAPTARTTVSK